MDLIHRKPPSNDLMPVRMVNECVYCPRLFYLMRVDGRWADNAFTEEGRAVHKRTDSKPSLLPETEQETVLGDTPPQISRSVTLGSDTLGIIGKLDLVESKDGHTTPVETKRGSPPDNAERSYEPERVQLMAQGFLLREQGYECSSGVIYYAASRRRVTIPFTEELEKRTLRAISEARGTARSKEIPPPLEDSPKCHGCSLSGICLPDETNILRLVPPASATEPAARRLYPSRSTAKPVYIQEQGARVGKRGEVLHVRKGDELLAKVRIRDISQLALLGGITISSRALYALMESDIPIVHMTAGHWFHGITRGHGLRNAFDRAAQFKRVEDQEICLELAREFVSAKVHNQRTVLRRNAQPTAEEALTGIRQCQNAIPNAENIETLLGHEGMAARHYFGAFSSMLRAPGGLQEFKLEGRNTRPPKDPVNSLLSFGYALLTKECHVALSAIGLDPYWGFYHQPRHGKPALALDLMEEFRPIVVDSAVLTAINTGMIAAEDFTVNTHGCMMNATARKAFIRAFEARIQQLSTHPVFGYRLSYRQSIQVQAQLLARYLREDAPTYQGIRIR